MDIRPLRTAATCLLLLVYGMHPAVAQDDADRTVRIRILAAEDVTQAELRALRGPLHLTTGAARSTLAQLDPGETATLGTRGGEVYLRLEGGGLYAESLHVDASPDTRWSITPSGGRTRTYAGALTVHPDAGALQLVNEVPLEEYVAGVVASEYTLDDVEGMKAMAVVARTYALYARAGSDNPYDHVDHVGSQVYGGPATITPAARTATRATRGEVLTYDGRVIQAVYSSSSGGHTANHEDVWDADRVLPYLRGKRDPYDTRSPHANWRASIPRTPLLEALSDHYGRSVEGFYLGERSTDGRVQTIELDVAGGEQHPVPSNDFRLLVNRTFPSINLKSTLFDARRAGDRYVFEGRGYGHGVGLSQWGAHEMARRGYGYRDILAFYYTDVSLASIDALDLPVPRATPLASTENDSDPIESTPAPRKRTTRRIGW